MPEVCFELPVVCPPYKDKIIELLACTTDLYPKALNPRKNGSTIVLPLEVDREPSEIENYIIQNVRRTTTRLANRSFPKIKLGGY